MFYTVSTFIELPEKRRSIVLKRTHMKFYISNMVL